MGILWILPCTFILFLVKLDRLTTKFTI